MSRILYTAQMQPGSTFRFDRSDYDYVIDREHSMPESGDELAVVSAGADGAVLVGTDVKGRSVIRVSAGSGRMQITDTKVDSGKVKEWLELAESHFAQKMSRLFSKGVGMTGADPEIFVRGGDGVIIPSFEFLPPKHSCKKYTTVNGEISHFWDGYQSEYTISPKSCHSYFVDDTARALSEILTEARKKDPKATLDYAPYVDLPGTLMQDRTDEQNGLGCSPSISAYGERPLDIEDPSMLRCRFAGHHLHFGWCMAPNFKDRANDIVKAIDAIAGVASVSLLDSLDSPHRRAFYGKAGEYRLPAHGLEYRVLPSSILAHPVIVHLVADLTRSVGYDITWSRGIMIRNWKIPGGEDTVRRVINECDAKLARRILEDNGKIFQFILDKIYGSVTAPVAYRLFTEGAPAHLPVAVQDMNENWHIDNPSDWIYHSGSANCSVARCQLKAKR